MRVYGNLADDWYGSTAFWAGNRWFTSQISTVDVALRLWRPVWHHERLSLTFRSDSMAVLHLLSNLRSKSFKFNLIV
eukprot:4752921-Amphidinium_carterae.1